MTTTTNPNQSQPARLGSRNKLHGHALSMAGLLKTELGSSDFQANEHAEQLQKQATGFMSNVPSSSHVNLAEITDYNKKRQRPLTGKAPRTAAAVTGPGLQQQASAFQLNNAFQHRRLPSAKADHRYGKAAPAESQLSNTRDVIQSHGYRTAQAGAAHNSHDQMQHGYRTEQQQPQQPIVRQHFAPTPANKRYSRPGSSDAYSAAAGSNALHGRRPPRAGQRPKSGASAASRGKLSGQNLRSHRTSRAQIGAGNDNVFRVAGDAPHHGVLAPGFQSSQASAQQLTMQPPPKPNNLDIAVYRLPSLSQCIGNQILPRNSQYMKRLYSIAARNHQNQVATVIRQEEQRKQARAGRTQKAGSLDKTMSATRHSEDHYKTLNIKNLQLPFEHLTSGGLHEQAKAMQQRYRAQQQLQHAISSGARQRPQTANAESRVRVQEGIDIFNNTMLSHLTAQDAQILSGDAQIREYAAQQQTRFGNARHGSPKRQPGSASKKGRKRLEVVGSSGLSPKQKPQDSQGPLRRLPRALRGRLQPGNTKVIPVAVADGRLVQVPESEMTAAQIKRMKDAADIPALLQSQDPGTRLHVHLRDVNTGEQHLVMYTVNEQAQTGEVSGGVIAGGAGGQTFAMLSPGTVTGAEPADLAEGGGRQKASADGEAEGSEEDGTPHDEGESMEVVEEDGLSDSAMKPKDGDPGRPETVYRAHNAQQPLSASPSGRALDTNAYRPITGSHRQSSSRQVNEGSRRSAGSLSAKRGQGGRNQKQLRKNNRVPSTHSLQLAVPNPYNAQQENGERDSDKQTNRLDELSQGRSVYGADEKNDGPPQRPGEAGLAADQEEAANRRAPNAGRPRSGKAADLRRGSSDREGAQTGARRRQVSVLTSGNQSEGQQLPGGGEGEERIYAGLPHHPKMSHAYPVHHVPLAGFEKGSIEHADTLNAGARSGASKDGRELGTLTHAMDSSTSRMSNPLNHFAYPSSDRLRPTHNPIKVKSIAFDGRKQIREVERGLSKLEADHHTVLSGQTQTRPQEVGSTGSGPPSQSRPTAQNQDMLHIQERNWSPRFTQKFQQHTTQPSLPQFKSNLPMKKTDLGAKRGSTASASPSRYPDAAKQATLRGRRARLHSAQHKKWRQGKNPAFDAEATLKIITQVQKDLDLAPEYLLARHGSSSQWLLRENSKVTILNCAQIPGLQNQGSQNEMRTGSSPGLGLGSMSARTLLKVQAAERQLTAEQRALQSFHANNVRANMRGTNANQLIEGIQMKSYDGREGGSDFAATLAGNADPLHPAFRERNQRMAGDLVGNEPGGESQQSLENLLIGNGAALDGGTLRSLGVRDLSGEQDLSTLNPMDVGSPSLSDKQHMHLAPIQNIHVVKKTATGEFESIEQSARILNVGAGTIHEQAEAEDDAERQKGRAASATTLRPQEENKVGPSGVDPGAPELPRKPLSPRKIQSMQIVEDAVKASKVIQSVYDAEAQAYKSGLIGSRVVSGIAEQLATPKSLRSNRSSRKVGAPQHNMDIQAIMKDERTPTIDDCLSPVSLASRNSRNGGRYLTQTHSGPSPPKARPARSRRLTAQGDPGLAESVGINITTIGERRAGPRSPFPNPAWKPPASNALAESLDQQAFNSHQKNAHAVLAQAQELLAQARVLKTDPAEVNAKLLAMFSGKVNAIATIHSFLDRTTEAMVSDTLNTVQRINIPLKSAPEGITDREEDEFSRQDGVQTDMNVREDQSKLTATMPPGSRQPTAAAYMEPCPNGLDSPTDMPPYSGGGGPLSSSTAKNANALQPFTGIAFGVNSGGASTTRYSKASLPQFGLLGSSLANELTSTARMQELRELEKMHVEVYTDVLQSADYVDFPHVAANGRPRTSKRRGYETNVIDYSKQINPYEKFTVTDGTYSPTESVRSRQKAKHVRPATAGRARAHTKQNSIVHNQKKERLQTANQAQPAHKPSRDIDHVFTHHRPAFSQTQSNVTGGSYGGMKSKFNQTTSEQQAWQAQQFMIDPSRKFRPVLRPEQRTKILVSQGVNTTSDDGGPAGELVAVEDKSLVTEEEEKAPVNIRMKRVTSAGVSSCQQAEPHQVDLLDETDAPLRDLGRASTHRVPSVRQSINLRAAENKPLLNRLVEELEPSCDSPAKVNIASSRGDQEASDGVIVHAERAYGDASPVPGVLNALQSVGTSPPSSLAPGAAQDFGDGGHSDAAHPGRPQQLDSPAGHRGGQARLLGDPRGSQVSLKSRSSGPTGQVIEKAQNHGYIARSKLASDSHFSVKDAYTNSSKRL